MSFGRHAYRHAIQSSSSLMDHVWISEDLLKSAFRRFANNQQRRYESRVPGPLEARRRSAKRRNTALAGIAGSGPPGDIAGLFGLDGRVHMKWADGQGWKSSVVTEPGDSQLSPPKPNASPFDFYNENLNPIEFGVPPSWPGVPGKLGNTSGRERVEEELSRRVTVAELREVIRQLGIDLRHEPAYSQLMFNRLLSFSGEGKNAAKELMYFLDDPFLNIQGAGNYLALVEHYASSGTFPSSQFGPLSAVIRALRLGLVPPDELHAITQVMSGLVGGGGKHANWKHLSMFHRYMWNAIGQCDIYQHKDLDAETLNTWLGALSKGNNERDLSLAGEILVATQSKTTVGNHWIPKFIPEWLDAPQLFTTDDKDYAFKLLRGLGPDLASKHIICVTETLISSKKRVLLERWQICLVGLQQIPMIALSSVWTKINARSEISEQHQIIVRLWLLKLLGENLPKGPCWKRSSQDTDSALIALLRLYAAGPERGSRDLLAGVMKGIHDLGLPPNGILLLVIDMVSRKSMTKAMRQTLERLESSEGSVADIFADLNTYNAAVPHVFELFEEMVRKIDVTSHSFIKQSIQLARTGNTDEVWNLIRLLRSHTPLKIALAKSWPIPDASDKALVRYSPERRTAECPDPHAALETIKLLAISLACSRNLTPRRSFQLVYWLYVFLLKHSAPVPADVVRALYHAGVVRFRREGRRVSPAQYRYILDVARKHERKDVVKALMTPF